MPSYAKNFITQVILRADFVQNTVPLTQPDPRILEELTDFPIQNRQNLTKSEVRVQKTPQGPIKDTHTVNYVENDFWSEDRSRRIALCSEYIFLETRRYEGFSPLRDAFLDVLDATAAQYPSLRIRRFGLRYINEIKLPEANAGPGLGADFWEKYINPLLLGGLRFAANDEALARHMCTTELNYGADRATFRYGVFNTDYPRPNRRREFVLDVDAYGQTELGAGAVPEKLKEYHKAALAVFEAAVTDALRSRMNADTDI